MPYSSDEGKQFIKDFVLAHKDEIQEVLDVGPGSGTYADLLRPHFGAWWTAVEVWAPYIEKFGLADKYNEVIVADINWLNWDFLPPQDLVILGDVLEHMAFWQATDVLSAACEHSRFVIVSVPIVHYPQGAEMGNPYETHVHHYSPSEVDNGLLAGYNVLGKWEGSVVGVYIVKGAIGDT